MEQKTQTGYLILADISGYTFFLANTELEHANIAISYLLETVVAQIASTLTIAKLEGDAVLAYIEGGRLPDGAALLSLLEGTYRAFHERAESLHRTATCPCRACVAIPSLDLKFIIHHGDFIIQQIAGIKDLLGSDVNLVHRLSKNHVAQATGWRGYALFTRQGLDQARADKAAFLQQSENYEHFGDVPTYVVDMQARYKASRAQ